MTCLTKQSQYHQNTASGFEDFELRIKSHHQEMLDSLKSDARITQQSDWINMSLTHLRSSVCRVPTSFMIYGVRLRIKMYWYLNLYWGTFFIHLLATNVHHEVSSLDSTLLWKSCKIFVTFGPAFWAKEDTGCTWILPFQENHSLLTSPPICEKRACTLTLKDWMLFNSIQACVDEPC